MEPMPSVQYAATGKFAHVLQDSLEMHTWNVLENQRIAMQMTSVASEATAKPPFVELHVVVTMNATTTSGALRRGVA